MYVKSILLLSCAIVMLTACSQFDCITKDSYLSGFEEFVTEVEAKHEDYSKNQWDSADEQFEQYAKTCYEQYKDDLTRSEREVYWEQTITYYTLRHKGNFLSLLSENSDEFSRFIEEEVKLNTEIVEKELQVVIDKFKSEDFQEAIDGLKEGIKEFSNELKDIFETEKK